MASLIGVVLLATAGSQISMVLLFYLGGYFNLHPPVVSFGTALLLSVAAVIQILCALSTSYNVALIASSLELALMLAVVYFAGFVGANIYMMRRYYFGKITALEQRDLDRRKGTSDE